MIKGLIMMMMMMMMMMMVVVVVVVVVARKSLSQSNFSMELRLTSDRVNKLDRHEFR